MGFVPQHQPTLKLLFRETVVWRYELSRLRLIATKAKQEPGYRFYALYDKVYRADVLRHAYNLVRSKKGAPGIDGVSFETIDAEEGVEMFLEGLAEEVKVIQTSNVSSLEESACFSMNNIGKPCTGKPQAVK